MVRRNTDCLTKLKNKASAPSSRVHAVPSLKIDTCFRQVRIVRQFALDRRFQVAFAFHVVSDGLKPSRLQNSQPDLEVRAFLRIFNAAAQRLRLDQYTVESGRRDLRTVAFLCGTRASVKQVIDRVVDSPEGPIPIRIYKPSGPEIIRPALVWFHGGGFVLGCMDMADGTCRTLAEESGASVISVDYRMAPEHGLSAARQDCLEVVRWVAEHGSEIGVDPKRIAVGGDSAGGNLAAGVAQQCAKDGFQLQLQVLVYPATDLSIDYKGGQNTQGYMLTYDSMQWLQSHISDDLSVKDPSVSPMMENDLRGVAPAVVVTAGFDPVRDDGLAYAERLSKSGVSVKSFHYPGQIHGFLTFDLVLPAGGDALRQIGQTLNSTLGAQSRESDRSAHAKRFQKIALHQLVELSFSHIVAYEVIRDLHRPLLLPLEILVAAVKNSVGPKSGSHISVA